MFTDGQQPLYMQRNSITATLIIPISFIYLMIIKSVIDNSQTCARTQNKQHSTFKHFNPTFSQAMRIEKESQFILFDPAQFG